MDLTTAQILSQKLQIKGYDKTHAKAELHRLLPKTYWRIIDSWLE